MRLLAILTLLSSTYAFGDMRCKQQFGETVCRDDRTGQEIRCKKMFGEDVCRDSKTGKETRCKVQFGEYVCR